MKKLSYEYVKSYVESNDGHLLLSGEYHNSQKKIWIKCPKNHKFDVTFGNFKSRNSRCPYCESESISKRCKTPFGTILEAASKRDLKLLTQKEEYEINAKKRGRILLLCKKCGYKYSTTVSMFNTGRGCLKCGFKTTGNKKRKSYENVRMVIESAGYELISTTYTDNKQKLTIKCKKHGLFLIKLNDILDGHGCRKCYCRGGKSEKEIYDFVKKFHPNIINNDRELISPLELDIYIPSLNLAIEYCGLYWHSEQYRDKNYHYNKMKLCNEKGIRLITIFEDEWLRRKEQVKNYILSVIGKNTTKIGGRQTKLKQILKKEAAAFLEETHIQGSTQMEVAFGLYHKNELVAVITGNKHHRQGFKNTFVLNRLAFKSNVSISGGSSKLLKALLRYAKQNGHSKIISWSDNRYSEGNVYKKLDFELINELPIDYSYVLKDTRISKQSCKKKNLLKKGAIGNTEHEMALFLGLYRIYDCGKKRWEINLSQTP